MVKVHTTKNFSSVAFKETMKFICKLAHRPEGWTTTFLWSRYFILGIGKRVIFQGPWIFDDLMVLFEDFDGKNTPESIKIHRGSMCGKIH